MTTLRRLRLSPVLALLLALPLLVGPPPARADTTGKSGSRLASISASISSGGTVIAAVTGRAIRVDSMLLNSGGAGVVVFKNGAGGTTILNVYLEANKPFLVPSDLLGDACVLTAGNLLEATLSGATLTAVVRYRLE